MILEIIFLILSIALLVKSSDYFVEYSSRIAKRLGISEFVIGLTLVALGTSLPELISSLFAAYYGQADLITGNIIGSNVANIALILGVGALLMSIPISKRMLHVDGFMLMSTTLLFLIFLFTGGSISRIEGLIMLIIFILYTLFLLNMTIEKQFDYLKRLRFLISLDTFKKLTSNIKNIFTKNEKIKTSYKESILIDYIAIIFTSVGIYFGAKFTVINAVAIAEVFKIPNYIIGFTVIALGTSLPELSVTFSSAKKGLGDILVGNVIGSNITNLLLVGGASALITPIAMSSFATIIGILLVTILLLIFMKRNWRIQRSEGIVFISLYLIFIALVVLKY